MKTKDYLARIADALEEIAATLALSEQENERFSLAEANAYHWQGESGTLLPVPKVSRVPLNMLRGIESVRDILLKNTEQFARGHGANNALLWGARGMGKSSLVKAIHADIEQREGFERLVLIEIAREDLETLPALMRIIAGLRRSQLRCWRNQLQIAQDHS